MAVGHVTYLDLTLEQRKAAAERLRGQVRAALGSPFLSDQQRSALHYQVDRLSRWEAGTLELGSPVMPPPVPDETPKS